MDTHYTYLLLMLGSLLFPLILSFDKRVRFVRKWKYLPLPMLVSGAYFIIWDHFFAKLGVWSFNEKYILGPEWLLLPLEEWLFFIVIPFVCLFNYECLNTYFPRDHLEQQARPISLVLIIILILISVLNLGRMYTAVNFVSAVFMLLFTWGWDRPAWLGRFYRAYLVNLIPFLLVNGVLTALPVVSYHPAENLGLRIWTIPAEDTIYLLLLLLLNTSIYERLKARDEAAA